MYPGRRYPYVFLNNGPFSADFRAATSNLTAAPTRYGEISEAHWSYPPWVPPEKAAAARVQMAKDGVLYGRCEQRCPARICLSRAPVACYKPEHSSQSTVRSVLLIHCTAEVCTQRMSVWQRQPELPSQTLAILKAERFLTALW